MAIEGTAEAKNLSTFHNGQWIWHSYGSSTTEFPYSRLTHSYVATEDYARTLPISTKQKVGLCVSLALTALVNFGLLCHNVDKARKIGKGNTKVVRRWLRISSSLGKWNMSLDVRRTFAHWCKTNFDLKKSRPDFHLSETSEFPLKTFESNFSKKSLICITVYFCGMVVWLCSEKESEMYSLVNSNERFSDFFHEYFSLKTKVLY